MARKLGKQQYPSGHSSDDFKCFGPAATTDAEFSGTMIADLGCFKQPTKDNPGGVDSNKYYHGAVVQSTKDQSWYAYFEYGRTGATNPQFLFVECGSKEEAEREYAKQLHSKNDKRGEWVTSKALGKEVLQAKAGKDCYLVRPQSTRSTGLPNARTITQHEGTKTASTTTKKKIKVKKKSDVDSETRKLMKDLSVGTMSYTRSAMADSALPTQVAIDEGRDILSAAEKEILKIGDVIEDQINNSEIRELTTLIYGRIPKKKAIGAAPETWILSQDNIMSWRLDLDAFESALSSSSNVEEIDDDPLGGMPIKMRHLPKTEEIGSFISDWIVNATRNKHSYLGRMVVKNVWVVERDGDKAKLSKAQKRIADSLKDTIKKKPFHQPQKRIDLTRDDQKIYSRSGTSMLFHGTRTVNVSGILRESLRMPRQLVGVVTNGAMFGPGLYFADDWKKSAGYTSLHGSYYSGGGGSIKNRGAFMFIADVPLGQPYPAPRASGYTSPPKGYHSVLGEAGVAVQNNEFIVYSPDQNQLRYLVEFDTSSRY